MDKVLDFVMKNRRSLSSDWKSGLEDLNIWDDVKMLYGFADAPYDGNLLLCYITLAYHKDSTFLEMHKDRAENKEKIMLSLAGNSKITGCKHILQALIGGNEEIESVINWLLGYQKDWRWITIISCFEYHSKSVRTRTSSQIFTAKENVEVGNYLDQGIKKRLEGERLLKEIRIEFVNLDTALEKEGRQKNNRQFYVP